MDIQRIIHEIDTHPLNRGLRGVDWIANPLNVAVFHNEDMALFDYEGPGLYQGHFFFRSRGKEAVEAAKIITQDMFDYGAKMIVGFVPVINRKAGVIARMAGYHFVGTQETEHGRVLVYLAAPEMH